MWIADAVSCYTCTWAARVPVGLQHGQAASQSVCSACQLPADESLWWPGMGTFSRQYPQAGFCFASQTSLRQEEGQRSFQRCDKTSKEKRNVSLWIEQSINIGKHFPSPSVRSAGGLLKTSESALGYGLPRKKSSSDELDLYAVCMFRIPWGSITDSRRPRMSSRWRKPILPILYSDLLHKRVSWLVCTLKSKCSGKKRQNSMILGYFKNPLGSVSPSTSLGLRTPVLGNTKVWWKEGWAIMHRQ